MDFRNIERRAHARVTASILLRIANSDGTFDEFITKDISMGGVFVQTDRPRDIGEKLDMLICFADGQEEIAVFGEVVRQVGFDNFTNSIPGPKGIGIRFIIVEPVLKNHLKQFLDSLLELKGAGSREHHRVKARLMLNLKVDGKIAVGMLDNISKGGLFLDTDEDFNIQDRIELVLIHPKTDEKIDMVGEVVHKKEFLDESTHRIQRGIGLRFLDGEGKDQEEIQTFIKSIVDNI
jgi:Tfp pilus assembly protein PilZ